MGKLLCTKQVAKLLGVSVRSLERYRRLGIGPPFIRMKSWIRYPEEGIVEWMKAGIRSSRTALRSE
jgi:predicted site-specific integrase-resolvase